MALNGAAGCRYGLPFPVLARAAFGVRGALLPAALRGAVAAGWFGIQVGSAASLVGQSKQKTPWKPTNRPTNQPTTDYRPLSK
jgi:purine-cytosine permease-like protein